MLNAHAQACTVFFDHNVFPAVCSFFFLSFLFLFFLLLISSVLSLCVFHNFLWFHMGLKDYLSQRKSHHKSSTSSQRSVFKNMTQRLGDAAASDEDEDDDGDGISNCENSVRKSF